MVTPILLLFIAVCFSVTGELLLKHGMNQVGLLSFEMRLLLPSLLRAFTNPYVILGLGSIFVGAIFWLSVLSRVNLSYAYPMLSISYILVVFASWLMLGEPLSLTRILGVVIIMGGVFVVYRS